MNTLEEIKHVLKQLSADDQESITGWLLELTDRRYVSFGVEEPRPAYAPLDPPFMTIDEYMKFEEQSPDRHEYVNGIVHAMNGPSVAHARIAGKLFVAVEAHLRGGPCEAFATDVKLRIRSETDEVVYYPDLIVACNSEEWGEHYVCNPKLVAEILSPSTMHIDRREKAMIYRRVASIEEYVLLEQRKHTVTVHRALRELAAAGVQRPTVGRRVSVDLTVSAADTDLRRYAGGHVIERNQMYIRPRLLKITGASSMSGLQARPCDELIIRSTAAATPCTKRQQTWVLAACVLGSSMAFIDSSVVNVALPKMESELATTLPAMTWVINAYTLCMSALLLIGGAAADQVGRRRIFMIGISIFSIASIGCGIAPNVELLILARAIQGVGAALLIPCSLAIIGAAFGEKERGAAIGVWSGASAIAAGGGPLLGGMLVDHVSWRAIFLINPVIAVPTILIALRHVPESVDSEAKKGLDATGAVLAFFGLGLLVYGLIAASDRGWSSSIVLGAMLLGAALLASFVLAERRSPTPMMPLNVFTSLTFSGVNILTLLLYGALGGAMFFLPFLLIQVHGYSATEAGAAFLPFTIILALLSKWGGRLVDRFGARLPLIVGPAVVALGFAMLSLPGTGGAYWTTFFPPMLLLDSGWQSPWHP